MKRKIRIKNGVRILPFLCEERRLTHVVVAFAVSFVIGVGLTFKAFWAASSETGAFPLVDMVLLVLAFFFAGILYSCALSLMVAQTLIKILDTIVPDEKEPEGTSVEGERSRRAVS